MIQGLGSNRQLGSYSNRALLPRQLWSDLGLLDYGWRRWRYEQRIMMTSEEQREEIREIQMDPQLVQRRRQHTAG